MKYGTSGYGRMISENFPHKTEQNCQKQPFLGSGSEPKANKIRSTDLGKAARI